MLEHLLLTVGDLWMAMLDKFGAQAKYREQCMMNTSVLSNKISNHSLPKWDSCHSLWSSRAFIEPRRHSSEMLANSAILPLLQQYSIN